MSRHRPKEHGLGGENRLTPPANRRLTPRLTVTSSVTYRATGASQRGFLLSLSEGGCCLEADITFAVRDPLTLLFHVGVEDLIVAVAMVRWTQGTRSGAEFVCMSAGCQERLREWVVSRA